MLKQQQIQSSLLILDRHKSHFYWGNSFTSKEQLGYHAKSTPHTSHKPLLSKGCYHSELNSKPLQKKWVIMLIYDAAGCVKAARDRGTIRAKISSFKKTGIFPFHLHVFTDDAFMISENIEWCRRNEEQLEIILFTRVSVASLTTAATDKHGQSFQNNKPDREISEPSDDYQHTEEPPLVHDIQNIHSRRNFPTSNPRIPKGRKMEEN